MTTKRKRASEAPVEVATSEVHEEAATNVSTSEAGVVTIALDEYLKVAKVNAGLVASFRSEAANQPGLLAPKSSEGWVQAFVEQSKRVYE